MRFLSQISLFRWSGSLLRRSLPAVLTLGSRRQSRPGPRTCQCILCASATPYPPPLLQCEVHLRWREWTGEPARATVEAGRLLPVRDCKYPVFGILIIALAELRRPEMLGGIVLCFPLRIFRTPRIADKVLLHFYYLRLRAHNCTAGSAQGSWGASGTFLEYVVSSRLDTMLLDERVSQGLLKCRRRSATRNLGTDGQVMQVG
jgi:hypothetical protein